MKFFPFCQKKLLKNVVFRIAPKIRPIQGKSNKESLNLHKKI